jgi:hypothetical protein
MLDTSFTRTTGLATGRFIHPARRRQRVQLDGQDLQASRTSSALGCSGQTSCQSGAGPRRRRWVVTASTRYTRIADTGGAT